MIQVVNSRHLGIFERPETPCAQVSSTRYSLQQHSTAPVRATCLDNLCTMFLCIASFTVSVHSLIICAVLQLLSGCGLFAPLPCLLPK